MNYRTSHLDIGFETDSKRFCSFHMTHSSPRGVAFVTHVEGVRKQS